MKDDSSQITTPLSPHIFRFRYLAWYQTVSYDFGVKLIDAIKAHDKFTLYQHLSFDTYASYHENIYSFEEAVGWNLKT